MSLYIHRKSSLPVKEANMLLRKELMEHFLTAISNSLSTGDAQDYLITGTAGMGKSYMLRYFEERLAREGFSTYFMDAQYCLGAKTVLNDLLHAGNRLVILVDHIDSLFQSLSIEEQYVLRQQLTESNISVIGACSYLPKEVTLYDAPFFDAFHVISLTPINIEDACAYLAEYAQTDKTLAYQLFTSLQDVTPITPRLIECIAMAPKAILKNPSRTIEWCMNFRDGEFEQLFKSLSDASQKVLISLARKPGSTNKELSDIAQFATSSIPGITNVLIAKHIVVCDNQNKKRFYIADRFFQLWLNMH